MSAYRFDPDAIRRERERLEWSQTELAYRVKLSSQQISHWELGRRMPDAGQLAELATVMKCPVSRFYLKD